MDNVTFEGAVREAVLFAAVWWLWINTTWATDRLDPAAAAVRLAMFALMGASLVMSMALPRAFDDRALAVELAQPWLGFPVPGLGRGDTREMDVEGEHVSERCGLFIILSLGETLVVTGARAAELEWDATVAMAAATALLGSLAMWWLYFDTGSKRGARAFDEQRPGPLARVAYTYLHLPIVAGIVLTAVGDKGLIAHPRDPVGWQDAMTILGGAALFLFGNFLFKNATSRRWPVSHLIGLALLALGVLATEWLDVLRLAAWAVGALIAVGAMERLLLR